MPVSHRELEALKTIQRYGGQVGYSIVAQAIGVGTNYARTICESLGKADYIDMFSSGLCKMMPKGMNELISRGLVESSEQRGAQDKETVAPPAQLAEPRVPRRQPAQAGQMVDAKCAYCWGRGVDPFGCPSPTSKCSVCGGRGFNRVVLPYMACPDCGGTGKQPGRRLTCSTCKGKGVITAREPVGRPGLSSVRSAMPTPSSAGMTGQVRAPAQPQSRKTASVADRASTYIASFPGAQIEDVQALLGLSQSQAKRVLQALVKAGRIKDKDELYYPA